MDNKINEKEHERKMISIAKTLQEFIKTYREGINHITGEQNLFQDITDEMIWNAGYEAGKQEGLIQSEKSSESNCCSSCLSLWQPKDKK